MFMYCFLLEVNQKLSDFRFPILNAKSIFRTFVRQQWENCLAHIETLVCVMKYLAFLFLWFWVVNTELVLYFFLKSTIHSRQTTLVWHGLYFLFDIGLFHATSVIVLRIYRRPRSGNRPFDKKRQLRPAVKKTELSRGNGERTTTLYRPALFPV